MKSILTASLVVAVGLLAGCNHMRTFTPPLIPVASTAAAEKGGVVIGEIGDKRAPHVEMYVFRVTFRGTWTYKGDKKPQEIVRDLIREGLRRRGITEKQDAAGANVVSAEITEFSGHNVYHENTVYRIACAVTIRGPQGTKGFMVAGEGYNRQVRLSDKAFKRNIDLIMNKAYSNFLKNLDGELEKAGF